MTRHERNGIVMAWAILFLLVVGFAETAIDYLADLTLANTSHLVER